MIMVYLKLAFFLLLIPTTSWAQETRLKTDTFKSWSRSPVAAEATLRKMHEHLIGAKDIEFLTDFKISHQALGTTRSGTAHYILRKPNLLRATVTLGTAEAIIVSDGHVLTIHEPKKKTYQQSPARDSIVGNLYVAAGLASVQPRLIDFFWSIDYLAKLGGYAKLQALPPDKVGAKACEGIRVQRQEDDWSVWLENTDNRLPCRLVSKRTDGGSLVIQSNTLKWVENPVITDDTFRFVSPDGHKKY